MKADTPEERSASPSEGEPGIPVGRQPPADGNSAMSQDRDPQADSSQPTTYQIRITGQLDSRWADWFEGLTITLDGGDTLITGPVVDQAALHGLLKRVRDLGMPLVSVGPVESGPSTTLGTGQADMANAKSETGVGGLPSSTSTTSRRSRA
jgi:hypothetical protein